MPNITRAQYERWSAKLQNGFKFDLNRFLMWGEKQVVADYPLDDGRILQATISYYEVWNCRQCHNVPRINISVWEDCGDFRRSYGLGHTEDAGEPQKTKRYAYLEQLTGEFSEQRVREIYEKIHPTGKLEDARIM